MFVFLLLFFITITRAQLHFEQVIQPIMSSFSTLSVACHVLLPHHPPSYIQCIVMHTFSLHPVSQSLVSICCPFLSSFLFLLFIFLFLKLSLAMYMYQFNVYFYVFKFFFFSLLFFFLCFSNFLCCKNST